MSEECIHHVKVAQVKNRMLSVAEGHYIIMPFRHVQAALHATVLQE